MTLRSMRWRVLFVLGCVGLCLPFLVQCSPGECVNDIDCDGKKVCKNNACVNPPESGCTSNDECEANEVCFKKVCVRQTDKPEPRLEPKKEVIPEDGGPDEPVGEVIPEEPVKETPNEIKPDTPDEPVTRECEQDSDCIAIAKTSCQFNSKGEKYCLPNKGTKVFGEECTKGSECRTGFCHPTSKACTLICKGNSDCQGGALCLKATFDKREVPVCYPGGDLCKNNADCAKDEVCGIRLYTASGEKESRCIKPANGESRAGYSCTADNECASGLCLPKDKVCARLCKENKDCLAGYVCDVTSVEYNGKKKEYKVCQLDKANGIPCTTSGDCRRLDYLCRPTLVSGKLLNRCETKVGAKRMGATCEKHSDCDSGYCLPSSRRCSAICAQKSDCVKTGVAGLDCKPVDLELEIQGKPYKARLNICVETAKVCTKDDDCSSDGRICAPLPSDSGQFQLLCAPPNQSGAKEGAACKTNGDCYNRFCFKGFCAAPCASAAQCTKGYECKPQTVMSGGNVLPVKVCQVPAAGLPCQANSDCPTGSGNDCRVIINNKVLESRCVKPATGSSQTGGLCSKDADCKSGTCLIEQGICTNLCKTDSDCPSSSGLKCLKQKLTKTGAPPKEFQVCSKPTCAGDVDCAEGQICQYTSKGLLLCVTASKTKKALGQACTANADCDSNLCHTTRKLCSSPCKNASADKCPLQYACETTGTGPSGLNLCLPIANACSLTKDCATGQLCTLSYDALLRPQKTCQKPIGTRLLGSLCNDDKQCESGICDPVTNRCSQFCVKSEDCSSTYSCDQVKLKNKWTVSLCRLCYSDNDCGTGQVCQLNYNPSENKVTTSCQKPTKTKKIGDACDPTKGIPGECGNHICDPSSRKCVSVCFAHRHCKASFYCGKVNLLGSVSIGACLTGKRPNCRGDEDCPANETCQVNFDTNGNVFTSCQKSTASKAGASCDPTKFPGTCASQLCDTVTRKCLNVCQPGIGGCKAGEICEEVALAKKLVYACVPELKRCSSQTDCDAGYVCGLEIKNKIVDYKCLRPLPTSKKVGDTCNNNESCASKLCHPTLKKCVATCLKDSHCSTNDRCGKIPSGDTLARACIPKNSLCVQSNICPVSEPVCALDLDLKGNIVRKCASGGPGTKKIGETCDPSKAFPGECKNRFCDPGVRRCTNTCVRDDDCPKGLSCIEATIQTFAGDKKILGCLPPAGTACVRKTDCIAAHVCRVTRTAVAIAQTCEQPSGKKEGDTCDPTKGYPGECGTRVCHPTDKRCTTVCTVDSDCANGFKCKSISYTGFKINVCSK